VTTFAPAGVECASPDGGGLCDGAGRCVQCLASTDCAPGSSCAKNTCVPGACTDGVRDGDETDVDCGGAVCAPCAVSKDCAKDGDCASGACDAWAPHRCLADHCLDHRRDVDETDIDCGGSCAQCPPDHYCKVNTDCTSGFCDVARGSFCLPPQCLDGIRNGYETGVDCGGGLCDPCALGVACEVSSDCESKACDVVVHACIADHCADHAQDADETYVDCGGSSCPRCTVGTRCQVSGDCVPGHPCVGLICR
jgi:hypothetical protein